MGRSPAVLSLAIAFSNALLVLGAPAASTSNVQSNVRVVGDSVDSTSFHIVSNLFNNGNNQICSHTVNVIGRGVDDSFDLPCNGAYSQVTSLSSEAYALYENENKGLSFFTETPSTLVVIKDGKCTKRSYKTSKGKTTHSEASMSTNECKSVKDKMEVTKEKWQKEFDENMRKQFPPCFPFCNEDESSEEKVTSSEEKDASEPEDSGSEGITETDKTSSEYWRQWQEEFEANMRKRFPPCFPFCNNKNPSKPDQDPKKNKNPVKGSEESESDEDSWNF